MNDREAVLLATTLGLLFCTLCLLLTSCTPSQNDLECKILMDTPDAFTYGETEDYIYCCVTSGYLEDYCETFEKKGYLKDEK